MSLPTITSLNDMGLRLLVWAWSMVAELSYTNDNSLGLQNMESYLFDRRNYVFGYFAENDVFCRKWKVNPVIFFCLHMYKKSMYKSKRKENIESQIKLPVQSKKIT